jgi:hypothetical protein
MFTKISLSAAAAAVALTALPATADARHRDYRYEQSYRNQGYYGQNDPYYGRNQGYYGRSQGYYGNRNYNGRRCSGTTGTIVGGVAGALLGREISRNGSRYRRGGSGTTGAILGGAIGALAGRAVDKSSCNNNRYYR